MTTATPPENYAKKVQARQAALSLQYDAAYALTDPDQLEKARAILSRIGSIDWQSEGYSSPDKQRDLSIKFHWGHNHRFAPDLQVDGRMEDRHLSLAAEFIEGFKLPEDHFQGKAVLDVGCWTGGTTLTLKMLGAGEILAIEEVRKYAETTHTLARDVYGFNDVECQPQSLYHLDDGKFDQVYIPGVVYHLSDPVLALRRLFNRLRDGGDILIESAGIKNDKPMCWFKGNQAHFGESGSRGGWAWFWPSASCLEDWMYEAGFRDIQVFYSPVSERVFGYGKRTGFEDITRAGLSVPDIE